MSHSVVVLCKLLLEIENLKSRIKIVSIKSLNLQIKKKVKKKYPTEKQHFWKDAAFQIHVEVKFRKSVIMILRW